MLIPIRCFTCGKTLADKWDWYEKETQKLQYEYDKEMEQKGKQDEIEGDLKYFDKVKTGEILDKLGLTRYCCRRHMICQVDMMNII